jgi:hypothetical protein
MFNVTRYGVKRFGPGSQNDCWVYIHKNQDQSVGWAIQWAGWRIDPVVGPAVNEARRVSLVTNGTVIAQGPSGVYYKMDRKVWLDPVDPTADVVEVLDLHHFLAGKREGWLGTDIALEPDFVNRLTRA